ncbi:hypothetical protein N7522_001411 [Penicillium canescens]|nr:hypothetical protein N7522_001411 [Penicillium canescens]
MLALHIVLYTLMGTSFAFAIVELGLSAYATTGWSGNQQPPDTLIFVLFTTCWSILVSVIAPVLPWFYTRKGFVSRKLNTILGVSTIIVYFVTSVFWLACFAGVIAELGGGSWLDIVNAVIAFAVLLWLLFLALFILAILAVCGVMVSDWAGYQSMKEGVADPVSPQTSTLPPLANDVPVDQPHTARDAASELSHCGTEPLHKQPPTSQAHSPSSPSGIASAEFSGDSNAHHHQYAGHP